MSSTALLFCIVQFIFVVYGQIGSDGFENRPCLRLRDFEIDGDWYAKTEGAVDWSSVIEGTRTTGTNSEWRSTQNQCTNSFERWGYYYKAGIFCDTFDNDEQSQLQTGTKHDLDCCPEKWVPLITTPMQDKGDLTNVYYVGSDLDLIICAAFERIDVNGASYMDLEFNQNVDTSLNDNNIYPTACNKTKGEQWKCRYPDRVDSDIQISFEIANDITKNIIVIYQWDTASQQHIAVRTETMTSATDPYYYKSSDGAFEAAVNRGTIKASSFGYICDDKNPLTANCPNITNIGVFFEACIDFIALGWTQMEFNSITVKARASSNGAYKDTSGVLYHTIKGPRNIWDNPVNNAECNMTSLPTTAQPTSKPTAPTTANPSTPPTTANPSTTPTTANPTTAQPTYGPTTAYPSKTPTTANPTTVNPTTDSPTTGNPTTSSPTYFGQTPGPTTANPTTANPTYFGQTSGPTTDNGQTPSPSGPPVSDSGDDVDRMNIDINMVIVMIMGMFLYW
mmetsp:Transcript_75866/g.68017  ORF Transcript_75866/g.68017 Transcript_75866/m.68017 type:complete len:507 (-) Transcript_75866:235-1755(-)